MADSDTPGPFKAPGETVGGSSPEDEGQVTLASTDEYDEPYHDPDVLHHEYNVLKNSIPDIAEKYGVEYSTVHYHMDKHGIERRSKSKSTSMAQGGDPLLRDEQWLREKYEDEQWSMYRIATDRDVDVRTVHRTLERCDIETRDLSTAQKLRADREFGDRKYNDEGWLRTQYLKLGKTPGEIASENGWDSKTVGRALNEYGIKTRSNKAAKLLKWKQEKCVSPSESRDLVSSDGIDATWKDLKDVKRGCVVPYRDRQWLQDRLDEGLSGREIAAECDVEVDQSTIHRWINRFDLDANHD